MSTPYLGEITMFAGNFAPRNWAICAGQVIPLQQNTALFSLLGVQYGGNGTTNFALPDFRGRTAMSQGSGPGLTPRVVGEQSGTETVTLTMTQLPAHTHQLSGGITPGSTGQTSGTPSAGAVFTNSAPGSCYINSATSLITIAPQTVGLIGGGQPHSNLQPFLTVLFIIATQGAYPSRN